LVGPWGTVDQRALDAIKYWLQHAHHPSFICVDGQLQTKDRAVQTRPFEAAGFFSVVNKWLRSQTSLPIWWSEWYASTSTMGPARPRQWVALTTVSLFRLSTSGTSVAALWDPEQYGGSSTPGLWTPTSTSAGGQPTPLARVFEYFTRYFAPGTPASLVQRTQGVTGLVSNARYIAVNTTSRRQTAAMGGVAITLQPYEIAMGRTRANSR